MLARILWCYDEFFCIFTNLEAKWGFDPDNGYSQVKDADFHKVMAYGEYEAFKRVIEDIEYKSI